MTASHPSFQPKDFSAFKGKLFMGTRFLYEAPSTVDCGQLAALPLVR